LTNADTDSYGPGLEKVIANIRSGVQFTHAKAKNDFDNWLKLEALSQQTATQARAFTVNARNYQQNFNIGIESIKEMGGQELDDNAYRESQEDLVAMYGVRFKTESTGPTDKPVLELMEGFYNPLLLNDELRMSLAKDALGDMQTKRDKTTQEQLLKSMQTEMFRIAAEQGWEAAFTTLRSPEFRAQLTEADIPPQKHKQFLNDLEDNMKFEKAQKDEAWKKQQETARGEIYDAIDKGTAPEPFGKDMRGFIESKESLSEKEQQELWEKVQKDESPFKETDPKVYFDLRRKIATDPLSVNEAELASYVGKGKKGGISTENYEKLLGMIKDEDDPFNNRIVKRAGAFITKAAEDGEEWLIMQNDYDKWYTNFTSTNKRPPNRKESEDYLKFLVAPIELGWWPWGEGSRAILERKLVAQLEQLPPEGKKAFVEAAEEGIDTDDFLEDWRNKKKKLTVETAKHYLLLTNRDVAKARKMWEKDGYREK